jgi:hypothetical protein
MLFSPAQFDTAKTGLSMDARPLLDQGLVQLISPQNVDDIDSAELQRCTTDHESIYKVVLLGDKGAGKTSILKRHT